MIFLIIFTLALASVILLLLYLYYSRETSISPATTPSAELLIENTSLPSSTNGTPKNKKKRRNIFKNCSDIVRKKASFLQRRHSTVGADFSITQAAKNFFRSNKYGRQLSVGGTREALPKPPSEFFEPLEQTVIPESGKPMTYIRQSTKLFEFPNYCMPREEDIEILIFDTNEFLLEPGDKDDSIFVVLEGCLSVYITPPGGRPSLVRRIGPGDCFFSSLSMLDIFMEKESILKTVSLKAAIKTHVARYQITQFYKCFKEDPNPSAWVRTVQIIITRLLHVVLTTLHQHMGLTKELINRRITSNLRSHASRLRGQSLKGTISKFRPKLKRMATEILENSNEEQKIKVALNHFREALQLGTHETEQLLKPFVKILHLEEHQSFYEEGTAGCGLAIVISGVLQITQDEAFIDYFQYEEAEKEAWYAFVNTGELVGGLQILTDEPAFYTVKAACSTIVAFIDKSDVEKLIESKPSIVFPIAYSVLLRVSSFVRAVDFALGWVLLDSGEALYRKGDFSDSVFIVLSGRLRSVTNKMLVEEFGKGDVLGIIDVLQQNPRSTTVLAVRYSQLAKMPEGMLNFVKMQYPQVGFRLVRLLGQYYSGRMSSSVVPVAHSVPDPLTQRNLHTIAIFPATLDVPLVAFTCELCHALSATTRVMRLSSRIVVELLGEEAVLERRADFRLMHWLNTLEESYHLVLYECDYTATNWTRRCLSQADAILVVACGDQKPPQKHFIDDHLKMNQDGIRSRKELILLWKEDDQTAPRGTYDWLKSSWFSGHYHIRAPERMFSWKMANEDERDVVEFYEQRVFKQASIDVHSDFARLGRIISGNAVGLVLGGGGARGAAHLGVIRALRDHGIPVDIVGGTSIGSLVGGIYAENPSDLDKVEAKARLWFMGMCSYWKTLQDLTWSYAARFTGYNFNSLLQNLFMEKNIEDLWLPYFCITTDITNSEMRIHRNGPLWRYVRASMSLAVYLPPICDSQDGHYLLDGGYVNNLPADVMRSLGARTVIAVDVSSADEKDFHNYGDYLNGFWAQFRAINPWGGPASLSRIMTAQEIQDRLAFVSSVRQLEMMKKAPWCNYLRPPIDKFRTLDFPNFDLIKDEGNQYAESNLPELMRTNNHLKSLANHERVLTLMRTPSGIVRAGSRSLHNSFTDLAMQLSRIPSKKHCHSLDDLSRLMDEEEEEEEDEASESEPDDFTGTVQMATEESMNDASMKNNNTFPTQTVVMNDNETLTVKVSIRMKEVAEENNSSDDDSALRMKD